MISDKERAERLRDHNELKGFCEAHLARAETKPEKDHLKARIAEIERDMEATKLPGSKALLPMIIKTVEEGAKKAQPRRKRIRKTKVGNPF